MLRHSGILFCFVLHLEMSVWARQSFNPGAAVSSNPTSANLAALRPPSPKPPVELFRALLAMTPGELRQSLTNRTPEAQKLILAKVREYQQMTPDQRELRLRVTELRWYLLPLLSDPSTNRAARLELVPSDLRKLVEDRLAQWDKLSTESQKQLLDNESTIRFFFELAASTPERQAETITNIAPSARQSLQKGLLRWQALAPEQRLAVVNHVREFFDVTPAEKERILDTLSEPERVQIETTLRTFDGLTSAQRLQCLKSFQKFASLSPEERRQFLKNAERWKLMSPADRQAWRSLVSNLSHQPPLPPGLSAPPMPPAARIPGYPTNSNSWLTNSN